MAILESRIFDLRGRKVAYAEGVRVTPWVWKNINSDLTVKGLGKVDAFK